MNNDRTGDHPAGRAPRPGEAPSGQEDARSESLTTRGGDHLAASPMTPSGGTPVTPAGSSPSAGPSIDLDQTIVPGQILFDCYQTIRKLGEGGMGQVWLVRHTDLNKERALKFIVPAIAFDEEIRKRFRREAQVLADFDHPNVVRIYDARLSTRVAYFAMEYLPGRGLDRVLRPGVTISLDQAAAILDQLCDVLQSAHERGIVHRDLKPANLMLVEDPISGKEVLKVLDFGIVKVLLTEQEHDATRTQGFLGTYAYASPEQILGEEIDGRSDIYSVGVILYQMLTGHRPFGGTEFALMHDVVKVEPPSFSEKNPDHGVPPELEEVVRRCLAKAPEGRYQTARELADDFLGRMKALWPESGSTGPSWSSGFSNLSASGLSGDPQLVDTETRAPGFEPTDEDVEYVAPPTEAGPTSRVASTEVDPDRSRRVVAPRRPDRTRGVAVGVLLALLLGSAGGGLALWKGLPLLVGREPSDAGRHRAGDGPVTPPLVGPTETIPPTPATPSLLDALYAPEPGPDGRPGPPEALVRIRDGVRFLRIQGGEFTIGAFDPGCDYLLEETPAYTRRVSTFYMQEHEVNFGEIERFLGENTTPDFRRSDDYRIIYDELLQYRLGKHEEVHGYPVVGVSRSLADAYAMSVAGRLPTEAQWEFAARSRGRPIHCVWEWGNGSSNCKCSDEKRFANLDRFGEPGSLLVSTLLTPGQREELNIFPDDRTAEGIYDLAGNVREWCRDAWRASHARGGGSDFVELPLPGEEFPAFAIRGGSFKTDSRQARTTIRLDRAAEGETDIDLGFRVVLEIPPGHPWSGEASGLGGGLAD